MKRCVKSAKPATREDRCAGGICRIGFQTCCIADFQAGRAQAIPAFWNGRAAGGFENPRLGSYWLE